MMMTLSQTKLVGLTMKLDLKVRDYHMLCEKLEELKASHIDPNDTKLLPLKEKFEKNYHEIADINRQIRELKEKIEFDKNNLKVKLEKDIFKKEKNKNIYNALEENSEDQEKPETTKSLENSRISDLSETVNIPEYIDTKENSLKIFLNRKGWFQKMVEKIKNIFKH